MLEKKWYTAVEAGAYFSKPPKTMLSLAARHRLPEGSVLKLGRAVRFNIRLIEVMGVKGKTNKGPDQ